MGARRFAAFSRSLTRAATRRGALQDWPLGTCRAPRCRVRRVSQTRTPSDPVRSASSASSRCWLAVPPGNTNP